MNRKRYRLNPACFCLTIVLATCSALGQAARTGEPPAPFSKIDIYGGYAYFHPFNSDINNIPYPTIDNLNATISISAYFTRYLGVQIEGGYFSGNSPAGTAGQCVNGACSDRDPIRYTAQGGVIYRYQIGRLVPFAHVLAGGARANGPYLQPLTWGLGGTGGVGVDYVLPFFHDLFAIRPIQADIQYSHINYGIATTVAQNNTRGVGDVEAVKLSGGLVARFGDMEPPTQIMEDCSVAPGTIYPGDPLSVTAMASNLKPKKKAVYTFNTTGGQLTPTGETATISTAGLAPGLYTVTGRVSQGSKANEQANCSSNFTVKAFEPPTLSCSASPSSVISPTPVIITATGVSPQNRQLTYTFNNSAGQITGSGNSVSLSTAGLPPGPVNITCSVTDDLGKSAVVNTSVMVALPTPTAPLNPVAPLAQEETLCSVSFARDRRRPVRVDNEGKGCLDDIALTMAHDSGSKLEVIGRYSPDEAPLAAKQRAVNVRLYLTQEKGIDPSRIEVRAGDASERVVENMLLPEGAFPDVSTEAFDPSAVHPEGQAYGKPGTYVSPRAYGKRRAHTRRRVRRAAPATHPKRTRRRTVNRRPAK